MGFTVDRERAGAANALATIRIERNRLLPLSDQPFVNDVQHLEK
jgi:hypothetical protein